MSNSILKKEVMDIKHSLGKSVVIPAHHYEMDEVVQMADFLGDSYKLAVDCAATDSKYIVFCGVMFMAEGAALLAKPYQKVLIPDMTAGCPMAEMIDAVQAEKIYSIISDKCDRSIVPIVYMNSYADMKAFCGAREGTVCTSSNAAKIVKSFLDQGKSVFFAPDYNLGINTANQLGLARDEVVTIRRDLSIEGSDWPEEGHGGSDQKKEIDFKNAKMFVWDGFCHVHKVFTVDDINSFRRQYGDMADNDVNVIVHPECHESVVKAADYSGSTSMIWNTVKAGKPGSIWAIGTELRFVQRMADQFKDKTIVPLRKSVCHNMSKITLEKLGHTLKAIQKHSAGDGEALKEITVPDEYREDARKALQLMIDIVEAGK
ncbi:MAG: quinolinate synthase NadA [Desulfamplus sp.]|nr:quinolinate synthase NadA [Desulfamplus sp.]